MNLDPKVPNLHLHPRKHYHSPHNYKPFHTHSPQLLYHSSSPHILSFFQQQHYLTQYKSNVGHHLVSPTKYKNKAEEYLDNRKKSQFIMLRAMNVRKQKDCCWKCFGGERGKREKCWCQDEESRRMDRVKSEDKYRNSYEGKDTILRSAKYRAQPLAPQHPYNNLYNNTVNTIQSQQHTQITTNIHHTLIIDAPAPSTPPAIIPNQNKSNIQSNIQFMNDINRQQTQFNQIEMNENSDNSLIVDFQELQQAKRQYVKKSHQIISALDQIINHYQ